MSHVLLKSCWNLQRTRRRTYGPGEDPCRLNIPRSWTGLLAIFPCRKFCGVLLRVVYQERREPDLVVLDVVVGHQLLPLPGPPTLLRLLTLGLHLCVAQHFRGFATLPLIRLILHRLVCRSGLRGRAGVRSFAVVRGTPGRPAAVRFRPASVQNEILS